MFLRLCDEEFEFLVKRSIKYWGAKVTRNLLMLFEFVKFLLNKELIPVLLVMPFYAFAPE